MAQVAALRFTPYTWQITEALSKTQQSTLADAVSKVLYKVISSAPGPERDSDLVAWTRSFVEVYSRDLAGHILRCLVLNPLQHYCDGELESERAIRNLTLRALQHLVKTYTAALNESDNGSVLGLSNLIDLAIGYATNHPKAIGNIFSDLFTTSPGLASLFKNELAPSFRKSLDNVNSNSTTPSQTCRTTYIVSQALKSIASGRKASSLMTVFAEDVSFIDALAASYDTCHLNLSKYSYVNGLLGDLDGQRLLRAKVELIDTLHFMMNPFVKNNPDDRSVLIGMILALLKYDPPSNDDDIVNVGPPSSSTLTFPLGTRNILHDYEYAFSLSQTLINIFGTDHEDSRVYLIITSLQELVPEQKEKKTAGWLAPLINSRKAVSIFAAPSFSTAFSAREVQTEKVLLGSRDKGKGKAIDENTKTLEPDLDLAVSQILDIFPEQSSQSVRKFLQHPSFQGDAEKVIAALLEGNLPPDLLDNEFIGGDIDNKPVEDFEFQYTKDRRNIWDAIPMNDSQLRIGKIKNDADSLINDRSFIEQMKADILRRAQELSDDEDDDATEKATKKTVLGPTFLDDADDEVNVKVIGDGEAASDSDTEGEDDTEEVTPSAPSPEVILELAYIDNPKLFDRDAATRRSKARADLKAKTGWGDEQIEGWRIMLERNPKKEKILQKHEFSGNRLEPSGSISAGGQTSGQQDHVHVNQGNRGRGGGRGGGRGRGRQQGETSTSTPSSSRDWKDKNKARVANHNRKRGHDKKMARGGGVAFAD